MIDISDDWQPIRTCILCSKKVCQDLDFMMLKNDDICVVCMLEHMVKSARDYEIGRKILSQDTQP